MTDDTRRLRAELCWWAEHGDLPPTLRELVEQAITALRPLEAAAVTPEGRPKEQDETRAL